MDDKEEGETGLLKVLDRIRTLNQDRVQFFAQLATLIPTLRASPLKDNDEDINVPESRKFWHRVLQWLVTRNKWQGVYCLFNPREIQPEDGQWSPLHGRAIGLSVDDVRVCDLLQSTNSQDLRTWGICLAIWLLKQGARIELISSDEGESIIIAAVKTSLNAGMSDLLSYVMEMRPELTLSLDDADQSGDSPLHLCVKFQQPDAEPGAAVLQTLLDLGSCTSVKDRQFWTPIQYVEEPDPRYTMLSHAANHAGTGLKDRVWKMKKLGDDHFQNDEFEESLSWYKKALFLAESAPNMKMELALLHSSCSCVYANLAVLEDKDLPTASSQMCKELCERKDLAAVLSNIKTPDFTPNQDRASEDKEGQEEKTDDDETEDDVNDDMKSDESRDEILQNNAQAIQKEQDLLNIEVRTESFEDEEEVSDESLRFDSDVIIYTRTLESDVVITTEAFEKAPTLLKNDVASREEQYENENEGDKFQATVYNDNIDHLSCVGIAESLQNPTHVIQIEQDLLKNIETSIEENIHGDNERTDGPSAILGDLSLPTGASKNTYVCGELQEDNVNTDIERTHTSSPEEAQECDKNFVIYVEKGSGNNKQAQDSFDESTLLNHSDCTIMFEVDHDNKQIMIHDQLFVHPGVSNPEQTTNDVKKNGDLSEARFLSQVDHDSRASDGHHKQNESDSSDQLWSTDDMIAVSNALQETGLTAFKGENENTEYYKETDGEHEKEKPDVIPTRKADGQGNNQFKGTVEKEEQVAEEPASKDEQVSGDTASKVEKVSEDTASKDKQVSGHTASKDEQVSGHTASKDKQVSGDTASKDEQVSGDIASKDEQESPDTASKDEQVSGDTASKVEKVSEDTASKDKQVSGDPVSKDKQVSGDTASKDKQESGDTASKDKQESRDTASTDEQVSGDIASKDKQVSGDTASKDEQVSGDTASKDEQVSGDTASKDEQVSGDTVSKDKQVSGDTASKDKQESGDTASKDKQESRDTASTDEQVSGDIASKDKQVSGDTASKDEQVSGDTASKDKQLSGDTASKDEQESGDTAGKDEQVSGDIASKDEQVSGDTASKDEQVSGDTASKDEQESRDTAGKDEQVSGDTASKDEQESRDTASKDEHQTETTPQKEITERINENQPGDEDIENIENWFEVSDNEGRGVMSFLAGQRSNHTGLLDMSSSEAVGAITLPKHCHSNSQDDNNDAEKDNDQGTVHGLCDDTLKGKNEDTAIPNAASPQVSKSASTPFAIDDDKMTPTKKKKRKMKKKTSKPLSTVGQSLEGNIMQNNRQDLNEAITNPKKKYAQEKTQHQAYQMKEKTISECRRGIIEAIQNPSSHLFNEKGLETESITIDSSEVVQVDHTDDINEMVVDNYEELANIDAESFDKATWEIECTANAWKQLKENNVPMYLRQQIIKHVQQLAFGVWKDVPRKKIHRTRPTYATKVVKSLNVYMVWEIAVAFSGRCSDEPDRRLQGKSSHITGGRVYTEIIRIWGIVFSEPDMHALAESISKSHIRAEDCILKKRLKILDKRKYEIESKKRIPRQFSEVKNDEEGKTIQLCPPASPHKTEYHILKFYVFSSALVNILLHADTKRVDLPFKVTHREHAIIHLQSETPILLLGRSGTGKTTCCLYRLWNNFISYWQIQEGKPFLPRVDYLFRASPDAKDEGEESSDDNQDEVDAKIAIDGEVNNRDAGDEVDVDADADEEDDYGEYDNLHQMFVTKNPVLCHEVKKNFLEFCSAHEETLDHVEAATTNIPATLQEVSDLSYPLFLTSKKLLLMLDASLGSPHFFARNGDGSLKMKVDGWEDEGEENTLLLHPDSDDEDELTEVDYGHAPEPEHFPRLVRRKQDPRKEVTYDVFVDKVWRKLQKNIGVKYHPSLVWTEMISFILGSQDALFEPKGYLSEAKYLEIGKKRAPNFSGDRSKVYELFLRYVHYKTQHQMFDEADFVRHIFQRLNKMPELPWVLHQLYVDETQDFTQSELSVLLRITQDPNKMFLTGDTAQGIMRGISFRFCDLKSLFHQTKTSLEAYQRRNLNEPKGVYQLIHSYRSHVGILSLASSVLELMVEFFPESFDRLKEDQGLFHGPQPILLESCSVEDLMVLMQGNNRDTSHIEFGAHQAILVVNQDAKTTLPEILYNNSIVLTIFESKGLEFDDVLLYNFFTDSEASKEWRVVTQYLESLSEQENLREDLDNVQKIDHEMLRQPHRPRALDFDPTQHKVLNSELKNLYTALTRARVNVWLFDENEDKRAPMFEYFKARKLVRSVSVSDRRGHNSDFQEMVFAMKSSESDWVKRGDEMMAKSLYDTAAKCYEMGFEIEKRNLARAHSQAQRAKKMRDSREMKEAFICAADMFFQCREALKATQCLQNAQEFGLAAKAYFKMGKLFEAAKMFQRTRNFTKASECLIGINQYGNAVHMLDKAELFEEAINCLKQYEEKLKIITREGNAVPHGLIENKPQVQEKDLWWKLVKSLHSQRKKEEMLKALRNLSREEHLEYLEKHKFYREAAELMLEDGKTGHADAAEMLLGHCMFKLALEYAEKGNDSDIQGKCHEILALDMISSDEPEMKDNKDVRERIVNHLRQAKTAFQRADNKNGVAMSVYHLSKVTRRIWDAKDAYDLFQVVKPLPNQVGMIESWRLVVESIKKHYFQDCKNLILNINVLLSVIRTLLEQSDATQRNMYKMYMQFYGLHENVLEPNSLLVHPKHSPLCADIIPNFYKKNERREKLVSRDKETMSFQISLYLGNILCHFIDICKKWLHPIAIHSLQCRSFIEGRSLGLGNTCANGNCQQLHEAYNKSSARTALEIMFWRVNLEANVSEGVVDILGIAFKSKERMQELKKKLPGKTFEVCEEFLDFVMSSQSYTGRFSDSKKFIGPSSMKSVKRHVRNFLKTQKGTNLEERCSSVDWIVRGFTFNALYGLEIDMHKECCNIEEQVKHDQKCMSKEKQLAFLCMHRGKESLVELFGTIFLDSCENLQRNVEKAVFDYTKYVKVLGDRNRLLNFPKWPLFLFWHETFLTVALVTLTKMSKGSYCVIPASYLQTMSAVDDCFPTSKVQKIINDTEMNQLITRQFQGRVVRFAGILCGFKTKMNLLNALFKVARDVDPPNFLHFERCLVLALVIMANVDWFSSVQDELMKVVKTFELLECLPKRLKNALEASQNAKGITDIVSTLKQLLLNRENEQLFCCKWMWKPTQNVGIDKEEIKSFEMFSSTFQSIVKDEEKYTELDVEMETTVDETEEEDLRLADDFEKRFQEQRIFQQEKLMDKSARTIQRFFRKITFRGILETRKLMERCKRKEVEEFLIPYQVTETMCGICSVALLKDRIETLEPTKLHTDEKILEDPSKDAVIESCQNIAMMLIHGDDMDETLEESGEKEKVKNVYLEGLKEGEKQNHQENLETHETHVSSQQHQMNARYYTAFKELYEEYFLLQVPEVHRFVASLRNKQLFIANPQEHLRTFDYMIDVVSFLLTSILRDRKWYLVFDLRSKVIPLHLYYRKASEEAEMWKQHLMFHQQPHYQGPSDEQTSDEMQPTMAHGGTGLPYHEETLDGDQAFDLVNVEYQPSEGSFGQHDDNQIYQQHQRVYDDQNLVDEPFENRNWHGRIRGQEYRRHGNRRGENRGRGREWGRHPRGNEERRDGQPRRNRRGGDRQPRGNWGREGGRGRGQRGARGLPNLPPRLQQLQIFNERIHNTNAP